MQKRGRGRPREFSPEEVLSRALEVFWESGFEATSLDDLSQATGLNRPSLYAAFGDKESLYLAALRNWTQGMRESLSAALDLRLPVGEALMGFYQTALELYCGGSGRGCMAVCTAPSTIADHPAIRAALSGILEELDRGLEGYLRHAQGAGGLPADLDCALAARLLASVQHSLAVRARSGQSRQELEELARGAVRLVVGEGYNSRAVSS